MNHVTLNRRLLVFTSARFYFSWNSSTIAGNQSSIVNESKEVEKDRSVALHCVGRKEAMNACTEAIERRQGL